MNLGDLLDAAEKIVDATNLRIATISAYFIPRDPLRFIELALGREL